MQSILETTLVGNSVQAWLHAALWMLGAAALMKLIVPLALSRLGRWAQATEARWDDALLDALRATRWYLVALMAMHPASSALVLAARPERWVQGVATVALFLQLALCASAFITGWIGNVRRDSLGKDPSTTSALSVLSFLARVVAWSLLLLLLLGNLGFDVNALVAGLGIGGIAVGLALQNILGDLFASLSIVLDKPFQVGDAIAVDDLQGTVENIGLKTTRVRSANGEVLVFSNGDLTKSRLRNFKTMQERRIVFAFGLGRDATPEQIEQVPDLVRRVVAAQAQVRLERAHFIGVSAASHDFEAVYWMLDPDFNRYRDTHQAIYLALLREFAALGVHFALPPRGLN